MRLYGDMEQGRNCLMFWLTLAGGIYLIVSGIIGKGGAFRTKMGTPLSEKDVKKVRFTYILVGIILLIAAALSGYDMFFRK